MDQVLDIHITDWIVLIVYFAAVLYLGVYLGNKRTNTLGDFFVAGGNWGGLVSFIFVFASALGGNEAVVVSGKAYSSGISGVWYFWGFLFATPIYYLFSTYYKRARVYNLAEFLSMRFGKTVAALYALTAGVICILFIGMFMLAIGKILSGVIGIQLWICIWSTSFIVSAYVFSGGMMSALLTDLMQGVLCLVVLGFIFLPFLWDAAGGYEALLTAPKETWDFTSEGMPLSKVLALNFSAVAGGIAAPWIFNWISISKNEKAATQTGWGHLWKRIITLVFAFYGILFALYINKHGIELPIDPTSGKPDGELAWGIVMKRILPAGVGLIGLLIASFFAAAMSSADTFATTSSAMFIDFFYRKIANTGKRLRHYLTLSKVWAVLSIMIGAFSTLYITSIADYITIAMSLLSFSGIPIYFSLITKRSNETGVWLSLSAGIVSYLIILAIPYGEGELFASKDSAFIWGVFLPTFLSIVGMLTGMYFGKADDEIKTKRFHFILNTPIGHEERLVNTGIVLPALIDNGLVDEGKEEKIDIEKLNYYYEQDCKDKIFSNLEIRREPTLPWYFPGFIRITLYCFGLIGLTWLLRFLFI